MPTVAKDKTSARPVVPPQELTGQWIAWNRDRSAIIAHGTESVEWKTRVQFFRTENPVDKQVILGHAGFLDYFNANFDGLNAVLTLTSNESLPKSSATEIK